MIKHVLFLILFFFALVLIQSTLLFGLPLIIIAVVLINIFYRKANFDNGIAGAFIGGFFLDIFSSGLLGVWVVILLVLSFLVQTIFKKYVRKPFFKI